eukprot:2811055-Heterocapsa_arctica.AAC.1
MGSCGRSHPSCLSCAHKRLLLGTPSSWSATRLSMGMACLKGMWAWSARADGGGSRSDGDSITRTRRAHASMPWPIP